MICFDIYILLFIPKLKLVIITRGNSRALYPFNLTFVWGKTHTHHQHPPLLCICTSNQLTDRLVTWLIDSSWLVGVGGFDPAPRPQLPTNAVHYYQSTKVPILYQFDIPFPHRAAGGMGNNLDFCLSSRWVADSICRWDGHLRKCRTIRGGCVFVYSLFSGCRIR